MVPVLVDGPLKLWESNAIMQYLADGAGADTLFPREPKRRADVQRWLAWELAHFNKALGVLSFEAVAKPNFMNMPPNAALVEWSQGELKTFAPVLDAHMAGRSYACGDGITIADYALTHLEFFKDVVPFDWSPHANLNAYFDRMRKAEHWAKTAPARPDLIGRKPKAA